MSKGNGRGRLAGAPQVVGVKANVPMKHRIDVEELHAHLANEHGCGMASAVVGQLMDERIQAAARFGIVGADGQVRVDVDGGELLAEATNRRRFEDLHRAHHDGTGNQHGPAFLHAWGDDNRNAGHHHHTREDPAWMKPEDDDGEA